MSDDVLVRCGWAEIRPGSDFELYRDYHDQEWGRPVRDGVALFERLSLEAFQSGLSWLVILRKRENFRRAFARFDIEQVAGYTDADVQRLMAYDGIVRNRAKIEATIANARAAAELGTPMGLAELLWSFAPSPRPRPAHGFEIPSATAESQAMARELKRRGFRFVGPTIAYALMQATGMVDDHIRDCWVPMAAR
ncbi:MAG TPA: DNA-3-methyladenine glycosylase I [Mycobacterium sp.]|nr:DNA-3-methyladenine glycosylase I [Mycobacterium sp.]HTX93683.1 DNA-3-methyladenine glycosylase I [Mycobacterium sp.]